MDIRKLAIRSIVFIAAALSIAAASAQDAAMVKARLKFFGHENVDAKTGALPAGKVVFSWFSNSSFAAAIGGRLVLLDTYVTRLETKPGRSPLVIQDLVDLQPEAIFLGHGHFDHADNAAYIAAKTGATIYATEETCAAMQEDFRRMKADPVIQGNPATAFAPQAAVKCENVTSAGSTPGTQVVRIKALEPVACVIAFRHLHSVAVPPDHDFPPTPVRIIVDPRDATLFPAGTSLTPAKGTAAAPGQMDLTTSGNTGPGGGASLFFDVVMRQAPNFTFVWHNTAGALKEGKGQGWNGTPADGQRLIELMKSLPPTDLEMGTASSGNFNNNGLRDLIMYQDALKPKVYIPNHLTTGTATREASSTSVYAGYLNQLQLMGRPRSEWPDIRWLVDPMDYLVPLSFDIADPAWNRDDKAARIRSMCG
jgi:L-ascorbate metabolism protein UlaG (beta-lactamase superfamily)